MNIQISEVRIRNFRSLRDVSVKLSPNITLLVGANNAGKTTFLRALNIALNTDRKFISQDDLFINKDGEPLPESNRIITIDVKIVPADNEREFDEKWAYDFKTTSRDSNNNEYLAYRTKIDFNTTMHSIPIRYKIVDWESGNADESDYGKLDADISNIPFYFIDAQRDLFEETTKRTSDFGKLAGKVKYDEKIRKQLENQLEILNKQAVEDSTVLKNLKENLENLNKTVQNNGRVEITPFPKRIRDLSKGMKVHFQDGESDYFSMEYHGMGTRSWASLLTFKAMIEQEKIEREIDNKPFHPSLGLEEPEAHLHPNAQRQVYKQLSEIQGQKIISTHSPYIVSQADLSELRHFSKTTDETQINELNIIFDIKLNIKEKELVSTPKSNKNKIKVLEKSIKDLRDDKREFLRKYKGRIGSMRGEMLFSRCLIFCEGETEEQALQIWGQKFFGVSLFDLGINVIGVDGYENYTAFLSIASSLNIDWFVFSDGEDKTIDSLIEDILLLDKKYHSLSTIIALPDKKNFEQYIFSLYPDEIRKAKVKYKLENKKNNESDVNIESEKLIAESDDVISIFMKKYKTKFVTYYFDEILKNNDINHIFPPLILQFFELISQKIKEGEANYFKFKTLFTILDNIKNKNANT